MDRWRTIETRVAIFTLVALVMFAPLETTAAWQRSGGAAALMHPGYLGSLTGMALLVIGAWHSLAARPRCAPAIMCAAHAWWAGVGWHAASLRFSVVGRGGQLPYGSLELWAVAGGAAVAVVVFGISLALTYRAEREPAPGLAVM